MSLKALKNIQSMAIYSLIRGKLLATQGGSKSLYPLRVKKLARPFEEGNKEHYLLMNVLDNASGTGYLPRLLGIEQEIHSLNGVNAGNHNKPSNP